MNKLLLLLLFVTPSCCMAQDVIVKKDGTTILSKVLEVNPGDIKYKKFSNQNGPTYTITKAEVMSINYESGDKDVFTDSQPATQQEPANGGFEVNPNLEADNLKLVQEFNQRELVYNGKQDKKANDFIGVLGLKEGSVLETPELKVDLSMKRFVTHIIPFYIPKSSTTGMASSTGTSVGFGGTHIGIGANSSATETSSTTFYSQRIVTIPPKGTLSLEPQDLGQSYFQGGGIQKIYESLAIQCYLPFFLEKGFVEEKDKYYGFVFEKLKIGESIDVPMLNDLPFSVHLTYSFDEQQKATQSMRQDFYIRKLVGADDTGTGDRIEFEGFDLSQKPMLYLIRGRKLKK